MNNENNNENNIDEFINDSKQHNVDFENVKNTIKNQLADTDVLLDRLCRMGKIRDMLVESAYIKKDSVMYETINKSISTATDLYSDNCHSIENIYTIHEKYENVISIAARVKACSGESAT
ncbi:TPA: hypothetical protein KOP76_002988 [Clostridioides difficile]|uniref:hypothetical protein n=2 Tax=Clostridioides difficile TaxID=1496 RepID=UPI00097FD4F3|nr:hypothetical protein [Clostridioides difficile]EJA6666508.1 hypothetical protein [Clostridioides difficile]MBH6986301.1 hypothetical protein [Clostridioides difficile]MBH7449915.1 hypothetical protein [Clostridioides difficile]MBZ0526738.1 hypothetical protein [Clostridioides difficile]MCA5959208.1 hypothetical protein [Clostridioides difficile]